MAGYTAQLQVSTHLSKSQKKAAKKQHKNRNTLFKRNGIVPVDYPTNHLVVANGGLDNNVSLDDLQQMFGMYGEVVDVVMQPQKSYAFVSMSSTQNAEAAFTALHGEPMLRSQTSPKVQLYLDYVESVPGIAVPSSHYPPGLVLLENFVTELEEKSLLETVKWEDTDAKLSSDGMMKHRRVKHYGYEFLYGINNVDKSCPLEHGIPSACQPVIDRLAAAGYGPTSVPDQLTVNQYQPGQGIPPHVDTHSAFEDVIVSVSLGSQSVMDFGHPDGHTTLSVVLPRRSALIMSGESRYMWTHGITPRQSDIVSVGAKGEPVRLTLVKRDIRTSFTLRKVRDGACTCKYPELCDSQRKQNNQNGKKTVLHLPESEEEAARIEQKHVHMVYEEIADHFSDTRHTAWPRVAEFITEQPEGAIVVDVGCGNGKYLRVNKATFNVGCDRSAALCAICAERGFPVFVGDALQVPLRSNIADIVISIAVIHHLSTEARRKRAVEEIIRVLSPGGKALIYVWALEQEKDDVKSNYLKDRRIDHRECLKAQEEEGLLLAESGVTNTPTSDCTTNLDITLASGSCSTIVPGQEMVIGANSAVKKQDTQTDNDLADGQEISNKIGDDEVQTSDNISGKGGLKLGMSSKELDFQTVKVESQIANEPLQSIDCTKMVQTESLLMAEDETQPDSTTLPVHVNRTHFEKQDVLVPWHRKPASKKQIVSQDSQIVTDKVVHRFYHVFREGELEKICLCIPDVQLIKSYYDRGNWCVIIKKCGS